MLIENPAQKHKTSGTSQVTVAQIIIDHKIVIFVLVFRLLLCLLGATARVAAANEQVADENLAIPALMKQAEQLESTDPWKAANLYCQGAREGLIEAQYRLAMLFAFGQGVLQDRAVAASLLSLAAEQGHHQALNMLETIQYSSDKLPECVLKNVAPPRAPEPPPVLQSGVNYAEKQVESAEKISARLPKERRWLVGMIKQIATWNKVDPLLVLSIVSVESHFQTTAFSNANAMGLMQLIPETAERFNVKDAFDASQNVKGGVRYLRWLLKRYNGNIALVAAAYNAGEGAVDKYKGVPPYPETLDYVKKVLTHYPQPRV